jgi:hypothetical protein
MTALKSTDPPIFNDIYLTESTGSSGSVKRFFAETQADYNPFSGKLTAFRKKAWRVRGLTAVPDFNNLKIRFIRSVRRY